MKKVCFIEFEGILANYQEYKVDEARAQKFFKKLSEFCLENKIDLYVVSGYHEKIAKKGFLESFVSKELKESNFFFVDENYLLSKADMDEKLHRSNLEKDPNFNDSFFKQTIVSKILAEKKLSVKDSLLLCNDVWVDAYYTTRFSKTDFALFEDNITDRGKKIGKVSGLAYFDFDFSSVEKLLNIFPETDFSALDKIVFEEMKKVLFKDVDLSKLKEKAIKQKGKQKWSGLNETQI